MLSVIKSYLQPILAAIALALVVTIYVQHIKIGGKNEQIKALRTELSVSNQSITDLTGALTQVRDQLVVKREEEQRKQTEIASSLRRIKEQDRSLEKMEGVLRARPSTSNCPVPEDLVNAWNNL